MRDLNRLKQKSRTGLVLLLAVLTSLAIFSCKKLDFTKTEIEVPVNDWLHYDNGNNYTGISANSGAYFDIAIRFSASQLANYEGFLISKVKFFPVEGYPAIYSITIWDGGDFPTLLHVQPVTSVIAGFWNEVTVDDIFYVDASQDLWIGIWIQDYPAGTFPAGCDSGPAVAGKGDLYSIDDGASWSSLYNADDLNYNWNLQVLLTGMSGQKALLENIHTSVAKDNKEALKNTHLVPSDDRMILQKTNPAHENN